MEGRRTVLAPNGSRSRTGQPSASGVVELRWGRKDTPREEPNSPSALIPEAVIGDDRWPRPNNLLVRGDARQTMRSILDDPVTAAHYAARAALCYIDPPFNRGETFAHYDDSLSRHEWLTMIRDCLELSTRFLAADGSIWVHLDDAAQHHGRCLLDEVYGADAFVGTIIWQKRTSRDNRKAFSSMHEYIHVYAPNGAKAWKARRNPLPDEGTFANPDDDPRGPWRSVPMSSQAGHATAAQFYTVVTPAGVRHEPPPGRCWTYTEDRLKELDAAGLVYWPKDGRGKPRLKRFRDEITGVAPFTIWPASEVGDNASAKKELLAFGEDNASFDTPKPETLLERIIHVATQPDELVFDFFLGSGTTAAVAHKMGRRWLGIELSPQTVNEWAVPRLEAVVHGTDGIGISPEGWSPGGGFAVAKTTQMTSVRGTAAS